MIGRERPRLCKNSFVRDRNTGLKMRFYAKSTSADVPINFRFNVDARTSILAKRFYTLWARSCRPSLHLPEENIKRFLRSRPRRWGREKLAQKPHKRFDVGAA
jgi:hypothetical protein